MQRLLSWCQWDPDEVRDDLQDYVAEQLGRPDGVLIVDDTGFLKKGSTSKAVVGLGQVRIGVGMSRWQVGQAPVQRARNVCSSRTTW